MKNKIDYASGGYDDEASDSLFFIGTCLACVVLSVLVCCGFLYLQYESYSQRSSGENYGKLALFFYRPFAIVVNILLMLCYFVFFLSLKRRSWPGLLGCLIVTSAAGGLWLAWWFGL